MTHLGSGRPATADGQMPCDAWEQPLGPCHLFQHEGNKNEGMDPNPIRSVRKLSASNLAARFVDVEHNPAAGGRGPQVWTVRYGAEGPQAGVEPLHLRSRSLNDG